MKRGKAPNARQKRWHDAVAQLPCVSCGATPVHIHHCVGSTTKHNKVHIGQDWVIPLCYDCHQGPGGVHGDMSRVRASAPRGKMYNGDYLADGDFGRKRFEKWAFNKVLCDVFQPNRLLQSYVEDAIKDYHK